MIKKFVVAIGLVAILFVAVGCGGGGGGLTEEEINQQISAAKSYLEKGDIENARKSYEDLLNSDSTNVEARFGRALCNLLLLMQEKPVTDVLASFGQPSFTTDIVFGENGYLADTINNENNEDMSRFPFNNITSCWDKMRFSDFKNKSRCIFAKVNSSYPLKSLASSLAELSSYIDAIIEDVEEAVVAEDASFTIPKGLYYGTEDTTVKRSDMLLLLSSLHINKFAINLANSWTFDLDLSTLFDANGVGLMTRNDYVQLLNKQFGIRQDNQFVEARTNLQLWAKYMDKALQAILAGASGGIVNYVEEAKSFYEDLDAVVKSIDAGLAGSTAIAQLTPLVNLDLDAFFKNPADRNAITSDPFVLEVKWGRESIKPVEAFWQEMIKSVCDYKIGTSGFKFLSDNTRAIGDLHDKLMSGLVRRKIGKYKMGAVDVTN